MTMISFSSFRSSFLHHNLDAVLLSSPSHLRYILGDNGFSSFERDVFLLVTKNHAYIITSPLYANEVNSENFILLVRDAKISYANHIKNICKKEKIKSLGFEENNLTFYEYRILKKTVPTFIPFSTKNLRIIKQQFEVDAIKKSCQIADTALNKSLKLLKKGITEKEFASIFEKEVTSADAKLSFPTIVAFGKNAATPHHQTDKTKLTTQSVVLIDCGVQKNSYCSDMTRTFFVKKPSTEEKKAYDVVKKSQERAITYIEDKLSKNEKIFANKVDGIAREHIVSQGFPSIPHSLGHGIGIDVHEAPSLSPNSKDVLTEGMVFSIEPGIYHDGTLGIRIEDLFAINNNQLIKLTNAPYQLAV